MRVSIYTLIVMLAALFSLSCKDQDRGGLTGTSPAAPDLSGVEEEDLVRVRIRQGDGPVIEKWILPVEWDGVSPLKPGVIYRFNSLEREREAWTITGPSYLKGFEEMLERRAAKMGKNKAMADPEKLT